MTQTTLTFIASEDLIIPDNRIRREFDEKEIRKLADDIADKGLMHPIVLRNDGKTLVAGERRVRAMRLLATEGKGITCNGYGFDIGIFPATHIGDLSDYQILEAELTENVRRSDLTIQEHAMAVKKLHDMRTDQHGAYDRATKEGWRKRDTAEEMLGREPRQNEVTDISVDLLIAENMDDPFVAAAKDRKGALKAIREREKHERRLERAATFDISQSPHQLFYGSSYELAPQFEGKFDVILTDPPYGKDIHKFESWDGSRHEYDDSDDAFQLVLKNLPGMCYETTKPQAHVYVFCDIRRFTELLVVFELAGFDVWPRPLIWDKGNTGSFGKIEFGPRSVYESVLYANKGQKPVTAAYPDVLRVNQPTNLPHPAGKPTDLYIELLKRSVYPGDTIADFYCGHGPIFPAAHKLQCTAYGFEQHEKYHAMAVEQLTKLK